jgi:hypothetical protein
MVSPSTYRVLCDTSYAVVGFGEAKPPNLPPRWRPRTSYYVTGVRGGGVWGGEAAPRSSFSGRLWRRSRYNRPETKDGARVAPIATGPPGDLAYQILR